MHLNLYAYIEEKKKYIKKKKTIFKLIEDHVLLQDGDVGEI